MSPCAISLNPGVREQGLNGGRCAGGNSLSIRAQQTVLWEIAMK